jgi:hypothetical protein
MADDPPTKEPLRGVEALKSQDCRWYLSDYSDGELTDSGRPKLVEDQQSLRAQKVNEAADRHWRDSRGRREDYARQWSMYYNMPIRGLTPRRFTRRTMTLARRKLSFNGCRAMPDAFVAEVTDQDPRVSFLTTGGTWAVRQRCKRLEKFNDGMLAEQDVYETGRLLMLDAAVCGTFVYATDCEGEGKGAHIVYQRDGAGSYFCDDEGAHDGDPREFYRRRWPDRLVAMAMFPDAAEDIAKSDRRTEGSLGDDEPSGSKTDSVCLTWAWHLPSGMGVWGREGTDTGDGMLVITCGNVLVYEGPITRYPFEFGYVTKPPHGVWGDGIVAQLMPMQWELDDLLKMVSNSMRMSGLRIACDTSANINVQSIAGMPNTKLSFTDKPPIPMVWPAVAPEVYQQIDRIWGKMAECIGQSQAQAQGDAPPGINSDRQLQTTMVITSRRKQVSFKLYQNFFLRLARQTMAMASEVAAVNPDFMVKSVTRNTMRAIRYLDAHLDADDFTIRPYATSAFANRPEAKMQEIQDSLNSGSPLISPSEGRRLLNDPDLDAFDALKDASYNLIQDCISDILEKGEYQGPVAEMNLDQGPDSALTLAQFSKLEAIRDGLLKEKRDGDVPSGIERIAMLDDWIAQVNDLLPPPPAPAPPMMPPGPPGAMPGAPPGPPPPMAQPAPPMAA